MTSFDPSGDPRRFRTALGAFATGVTVVTTQGPLGPLGITANSFASVSLDPPLVLWAPARASARFDAFAGADHFAIHVLGLEQRSISDAFSRSGEAFQGLDWTEDPHGTPILQDTLARFTCETVARHDGGDHMIVVARVHEAARRDGAPLAFQGGRFGTMRPTE
ncbi:MAG: flavin reductase family protein [Rubellimicrobium sp.]|nr:flavin reductase family protein [Rubellimicrobium sp.]